MSTPNRRTFIKQTGLGVAGTAAVHWAGTVRAAGANQELVMGAIGCGGQGTHLATSFAQRENVRVAYVCDPDRGRAIATAKKVEEAGGTAPVIVSDLRRILDDRSIDAVTVATPDHWHAPAAILACDAGKHVYVEKPCAHNLREGRLLVEAARRNDRVVQHGTQSRSLPVIVAAIRLVREGAIGDVLVARAWNIQRRANIGHASPGEAPGGLDYAMWLGPAPYVPYQSNRLHYNWHWWYDFGTGDMGNDGVHELDYARWGLGVETHPTSVSALGGKYFFDDDQQFPDTQQVAFEYPGDGRPGSRRMLIYEQRLWSTNYPNNVDNGVEFIGTKGKLFVTKRGKLQIWGERNKARETPAELPDILDHHADFLEAIRGSRRSVADIEIGHLSASLCHLGNIATRLGRSLRFDAAGERFTDDDEANRLLARTYRDGHWAVPA